MAAVHVRTLPDMERQIYLEVDYVHMWNVLLLTRIHGIQAESWEIDLTSSALYQHSLDDM